MRKFLLEHFKALKCLHPQQSFWVFNKHWQVAFANAMQYINAQFNIYSPISNTMLTLSQFRELVISRPDMIIHNNDIEIIVSCTNKGEEKLLLFTSSPLYHNNSLIGFVVTECGDVGNYEYTKMMNFVLFNGKEQNAPHKIQGKRILEISFFIVRGYTYKEIAETLSYIHNKSISPSTIGNMVRNILYEKFNVCNRIALKKALLQNSLSTVIPESIMKFGINNLNRKEVKGEIYE